ncbi:MAG TPA: VTT domain-containing protein [Pseudonocardiaceae bacterium]|nr:VTT domain-containing protein [Pseudonocardiaceae bacterium]
MTLPSGTPLALGPSWLDPEHLLNMLGPYVLVGLCVIIFAECGLLIGFFLPGDSLLFTAGLFVAAGFVDTPIWLVCALLTVCAVAGNVVGYGIGYKVGPVLFSRPDSTVLKREYVDKTHDFFERYGARAIVLARFVPIVRTFITAIAGVGRMNPRTYLTYSVAGGIAWATGVTLLGFWLGRIPFVKDNIELMLIGIVLLSIVPIIGELVRARREIRRAALSVSPGAPRGS